MYLVSFVLRALMQKHIYVGKVMVVQEEYPGQNINR